MADDRYSWLDKDAAERLLRGEPVGSRVGDGARELEQLLEAAAAAGTGLPETAPLPGEEAALAAFRQARHGPAARPRETARTARAAERAGLARPFRRGFAVALAVCAISGIAVAAGTGVLPTPFEGGEPAQPGATVTAAESPSLLDTERPAATTGGTGRTPTPPGGRTTAPGATPPPGGSHGTTPAPGTPAPGGTPGDDDGHRSDPDGKDKKKPLLTLCKNYETGNPGALDRDTLERLQAAAGGPGKVHAFCRQYLLTAGRPGSGTGDNDGAGGRTGGGKGNGNGKGRGHGNGGGNGTGGGSGDEEGDSAGRSGSGFMTLVPVPATAPGTVSPAPATVPATVSPAATAPATVPAASATTPAAPAGTRPGSQV
ncbi:hypothetical protein ADL22_21140 [Streptomyces sp. NRRL F-4489]|uniref:hypothetical protein n=1 Tax=Streptomyces sp. NRRL F-4489 TaxID=1609095 RepID=UPI0007496353|nr:hypothetical protein [Streptomyces sp. NRRL F-4489]KUL37469.1 hypothetical protein ADL22_21140 [Streptomyces sp. NRRL F-4489]